MIKRKFACRVYLAEQMSDKKLSLSFEATTERHKKEILNKLASLDIPIPPKKPQKNIYIIQIEKIENVN